MSSNLVFSFLDSDVAALLSVYPQFALDHYCLLTCIDSSTNVVEAARAHLSGEQYEVYGNFIVLPGELLISKRYVLLTGFDEVFYFNGSARPSTLSPFDVFLWEAHFTSDRFQFHDELPPLLRKIFETSHAVRYSSDGCGLNVICETPMVLEEVCQALSTDAAL